jgi:hypothetical protein
LPAQGSFGADAAGVKFRSHERQSGIKYSDEAPRHNLQILAQDRPETFRTQAACFQCRQSRLEKGLLTGCYRLPRKLTSGLE